MIYSSLLFPQMFLELQIQVLFFFLELPILTKVVQGRRSDSLVFCVQEGNEYHQYNKNRVGPYQFSTRCCKCTSNKCLATMSFELLDPRMTRYIGKNAAGKTQYRFNFDKRALLLDERNYRILPNPDRKRGGHNRNMSVTARIFKSLIA